MADIVMHQEQAAVHKDQLNELWAQAEQQTSVRERLDRAAAPLRSPPLMVAMHRKGDGDDPQVLMEAFQVSAEACQWPAVEWVLRLLLLLSGVAQTAAVILPPCVRGAF